MNKPPAVSAHVSIESLPEVLRPRPLLPASRELRPGDLCPECQEERLDYDGMLNLACPKCGTISGGCFT